MSTRSGAEIATGGVRPVWSMTLYLPGPDLSYSATCSAVLGYCLVAAFGRLQLGGHVEDAGHVLPRVVVVPDGGGQRAAVAAAVPAKELACSGDGVGRAVHVGLVVAVAVGGVGLPRTRQELHRADGARPRARCVPPVLTLDFADGGHHRPREAGAGVSGAPVHPDVGPRVDRCLVPGRWAEGRDQGGRFRRKAHGR